MIGCILPDWNDSSLPAHTRAQVSKQVATRLQTVRDVAAGACGAWMEKHRQAMGSIEQREQAMGWLQQTFAAWRRETREQASRDNNIYMSQSVSTRSLLSRRKRKEQQQRQEREVRKEKPAFRDTPRGRRCKDFTDEAGYLRCEWARLRLAMLRGAQEKRGLTTRPGTARGTADAGARRVNDTSEYTARRGQMHIQARIGMKLMRIIESDRDRRTEIEDHG